MNNVKRKLHTTKNIKRLMLHGYGNAIRNIMKIIGAGIKNDMPYGKEITVN
jgi:hypothetical protein